MQAYTPPRKTFGFFSKKVVAFGLGVVVLAGLIFTVYTLTNNEVKVVVDEKNYKLTVFGGTVAEALQKSHVKLREKDVVEPALATKLEEGMKITVTRAIDVAIIADGQTIKVRTPIREVEEILKEANLSLGENDKVEPELDEEVESGDAIKVIRVTDKLLYVNRALAFKVENRPDPDLFKGFTRVLRDGKPGTAQKTIKVTLEDGKEVGREVVGEKIVRNPISKLVAVGTMREKVTSRGTTIRFSKVIVMNASGYSYTGHNTASGVPPRPGVAAVDPRIIPMGTRLYVEGYGYCTALDVGSAIKGNKIDLFFGSDSQAEHWGRRNVKVYILE